MKTKKLKLSQVDNGVVFRSFLFGNFQKVEDEDESICCFFCCLIIVGNLQTFRNELGLNPMDVSMFKRLDAQDVNVSQSGHGFGTFTLFLRQYCLSTENTF